jgi:hypothetical protein
MKIKGTYENFQFDFEGELEEFMAIIREINIQNYNMMLYPDMTPNTWYIDGVHGNPDKVTG